MAKGIVVGVDGSDASRAALRWAREEAVLRGSQVKAVHVWRYPLMTHVPGIVDAPIFARDDLEEEARALLDKVVSEVEAESPGQAAPVERKVVEGVASAELVRHAEGAELLVVGNRGRGGFADLLLGSVAHQVTSHASIPVVVVRASPLS